MSKKIYGLRKSIYKAFMKEGSKNKEAFFEKLWRDLSEDIREERIVKLRPNHAQRIQTAKGLVGKKFTHTREDQTATFEITAEGKFMVPDGTIHERATRAIWDQYRITTVKNPGNNAWKEAVDEHGKAIDDYWYASK